MICALVVDLPGHREFPVIRPVLGRALAVYPFMAIKAAQSVERAYLMTDSKDVKALALQYGMIAIDLPNGASTLEPLLRHGWAQIKKDLANESKKADFLALLMTHAPCVTGQTIDQAVEALEERPDADSAMSVSRYDFFNPFEARRETGDGRLEPFVPPHKPSLETWYPDWGLTLARARSLDELAGPPPRPWLGKAVLPVKQEGGAPVEFAWQIPAIEHWLKSRGVSDISPTLELQPKPKPQPKGDRR